MYRFKSFKSPKSPQSPVKEDVYWERRGPITPPLMQYPRNKYYFAGTNTPSQTPKSRKRNRTKLGPTKFQESPSSNSNQSGHEVLNIEWDESLMATPPRTPIKKSNSKPFNIPDANTEDTPPRRRTKKYSKFHGSIKLPASWKYPQTKWKSGIPPKPTKQRYYTSQYTKTLPSHIPKNERR